MEEIERMRQRDILLRILPTFPPFLPRTEASQFSLKKLQPFVVTWPTVAVPPTVEAVTAPPPPPKFLSAATTRSGAQRRILASKGALSLVFL